MDLKAVVASLSEIERKTLLCIDATPKAAEGLAAACGLNIDSVRRACSWLSEKGLAKTEEVKETKIVLTKEGEGAFTYGLAERRMLNMLSEKGKMGFKELQQAGNFTQQEFNIALGINKRRAFVAIFRGTRPEIGLSEVGKDFIKGKSEEEEAIAEIAQSGGTQKGQALQALKERGLAEEKEDVQRLVSITPEGGQARRIKEFSGQRHYNILNPVPPMYIGKKQPYIQFLNIIRRKLTELGFKEMEAPLIVHEFYNFDVLFQPQNHPARTWTDTYQLKNPSRGTLHDKKAVNAVKAAHETGGVSASCGWRYNWLEEIASKLMPTAHGTAHSARQLTKGVEMPGKYFAIARCFRPDVLDATHLIEFNQTEGFIAGEDLNFTHLLGVLEQFAREIAGAKEVKFLPDYYPFTEPSVQLSAKHPSLGWVELGGAGMFRPEILENLGIKGQAIAWGIGVDRLAMFKLGIKDIRYLFSDDLDWLRRTPLVKG
ncbi:MAG TPA: phenylalanine--tRNA ligase subunit alpha [Candidatus Diapherotrites archaeon]|uniref:phenylalanine--tRNA ligase n=1 Tax=Candidatus Iainarchaeum sp. TaxID=3101447 RepID=A0A7J4IZZ4_9ARCH|nr:phenylalanine--tRNA ligase subunit alpha [Candidatus Diapherotrites archaeon]